MKNPEIRQGDLFDKPLNIADEDDLTDEQRKLLGHIREIEGLINDNIEAREALVNKLRHTCVYPKTTEEKV